MSRKGGSLNGRYCGNTSEKSSNNLTIAGCGTDAFGGSGCIAITARANFSTSRACENAAYEQNKTVLLDHVPSTTCGAISGGAGARERSPSCSGSSTMHLFLEKKL